MNALDDMKNKYRLWGNGDIPRLDFIVMNGYNNNLFDEADRAQAAEELAALKKAAKQAQEALIVARDDHTLSELAWGEVTNAIHALAAVLEEK